MSGRFDMLCPPLFAAEVVAEAHALGKDANWRQTIVEHAAHSEHDPGMSEAIREALGELLLSDARKFVPVSELFQ